MHRLTLWILIGALLQPIAALCAEGPDVTRQIQFSTDHLELIPSGDAVRVDYRGGIHAMPAGSPDLPAVLVWLQLPDGTRATDVTTELVDEIEVGTHRVAPARGDHGFDQPPAAPALDPTAYGGDMPFPTRWAELATAGFLRGRNLVAIQVHPTRWSPSTGRLVLARSLQLRVTLTAASDERPLQRNRIVPSIEARFERGLQRVLPEMAAGQARGMSGNVADPGPYQPTFRPSADGSPVEYVIVTRDELVPEFQRLADWKTRKGVQAVVRSIEWIDATYPNGVDQAERLRFFVRDAYQNWGTLWILLGGDTDILPHRNAETTFCGGESIPTDYYFMALDGNWNADADDRFGEGRVGASTASDEVDLLPEVYVGRAPVSNLEQAQVFVDKTLEYETGTENVNEHPASALFLAERIFPAQHGAEIAEQAVERLPSWMKIVRLYEESATYPGSLPLTGDAAIDSVNNGFGLVHHVGHGYRNTMSIGEASLGNSDADGFTNADRSSIVFAISCSAVSMDFNSIGERWVKNPGGGAVGFLGTSRLAFTLSADDVQNEWYDLVFADSLRALGEASTLARLPLVSGAEWDTADRWMIFALTLLGDPELDVYTNARVPIDVVHPATHTLGTGPLPVLVTSSGEPLVGASVTLWKSGAFYAASTTDATGAASLPFTGDATGEHTLTVHRSHYVPYEGTVDVIGATGPYAVIDQVTIDDDAAGGSSGDGDGLVDAGESIELWIAARNAGGAAMTGLTGTLTVDDPSGHVTIVDDTVTYGDVGAGQAVPGLLPFRLDIDPATPDAFQPVCTLALDANEGDWTNTFVLPVRRAYLEHHAHVANDDFPRGNGNGIIEPGETIWYTITLRNRGQETAFDVTATLSALRRSDGMPHPDVPVTDASMTFGDVAVDGTVTGDRADFVVGPTVDPTDMLLEVTFVDRFGTVRVEQLDVVPPVAPTGFTSRGATTSVTLLWSPPADADVLGYDVYRAESEHGPFVRVNEYTAVGSSLYQDGGLAPLSTFFYQVAARDSSFNEGERGVIFTATTSPPFAGGWPIEVGQLPSSSVQVADVDGDLDNEVFMAADYQYGWHADGLEIVDGDDDALTSGVLTVDGYDADKGFGATSAVADVNRDGSLEICNVGWTVKQIHLWDAQGVRMPGWPKAISSDFNWGSPVLADLDADLDLEVILWAAGGTLYAWHHDGTEVVDGDGDPGTDGVVRVIDDVSFNYASAAVGNLDGDSQLEIVFCTNFYSGNGPRGAVYVVDPDGTDVAGWPVFTGDVANPSQITASPAIVDLDGDGVHEILVTSERAGGRMHVFTSNGTDAPGWPRSVPVRTTGGRVASPVVGDVDGDDELDVVVIDSDGALRVWDRFGSILPGFPVTYSTDEEATQSTPAVADIDDDGFVELLFGDQAGRLHAYNHDGTTAGGFPIQLNGEIHAAPWVGDLDGDALVEIAVTATDLNVYIWDLPFTWRPESAHWRSFRFDPANTGVYREPMVIGVGDDGALGVPSLARVHRPAPNPFNPSTRIVIDVAGDGGLVELDVFDVQGRLVEELLRGALPAGTHALSWDGVGVRGAAPSGVYFLRYRIGEVAGTHKILLAR